MRFDFIIYHFILKDKQYVEFYTPTNALLYTIYTIKY